MKLSISNIAWGKEIDEEVYSLMNKYSFQGLEIAPTRIFENNPYEKLEEIKKWYLNLNNKYGFVIPSMQSIWYGRNENIFNSLEERNVLIEYTKKAIDFASTINCKNLVFGCPKNRCINEKFNEQDSISFFKEIGDYAYNKGTCIALEANPPIYNTNYINKTLEAIDLIKKVNSKGFKLNLDIGTIIYNKEDINELIGDVKYINHVHVSEPMLVEIEQRQLHKEIKQILLNENYENYVSIEMRNNNDISTIEKTMKNVKKIYE